MSDVGASSGPVESGKLLKTGFTGPNHMIHITLSTNHATVEAAQHKLLSTKVPFWVGGRLRLSTQMYDIDPLEEKHGSSLIYIWYQVHT